VSLSYWIDNLGFITEGKLAAIFIKTFSWGFPTGRSFLLHHVNLAPSHTASHRRRRCEIGRIQELFPAPCRRGESLPEAFSTTMVSSRVMCE
jgi:hypothetical protein